MIIIYKMMQLYLEKDLFIYFYLKSKYIIYISRPDTSRHNKRI